MSKFFLILTLILSLATCHRRNRSRVGTEICTRMFTKYLETNNITLEYDQITECYVKIDHGFKFKMKIKSGVDNCLFGLNIGINHKYRLIIDDPNSCRFLESWPEASILMGTEESDPKEKLFELAGSFIASNPGLVKEVGLESLIGLASNTYNYYKEFNGGVSQ